MQNYHLDLSHLNNNLSVTFGDFFKYVNNQHQHHIREAYNNKSPYHMLKLPATAWNV